MGIHFKVRGIRAGNDSWGKRFLAYVEIEATRASRKDIAKEGRKERMNEYAFHSRGMEFVVTLAVSRKARVSPREACAISSRAD